VGPTWPITSILHYSGNFRPCWPIAEIVRCDKLNAADPAGADRKRREKSQERAKLLFPIPANETQRLAAVRELNILDTAPDITYGDRATVSSNIGEVFQHPQSFEFRRPKVVYHQFQIL
jgi:hypothetical protein